LYRSWRTTTFDIANHAAGGRTKARKEEKLWFNWREAPRLWDEHGPAAALDQIDDDHERRRDGRPSSGGSDAAVLTGRRRRLAPASAE
jgi:hypothetical protein